MTIIAFGDCPCGERGALYAGLCHWCRLSVDLTGQPLDPAPPRPARTIAAAVGALVAELEEEEIAQPLTRQFTLAALASDLCRLAGEPVPAAVLDALDGPACAPLRLDRAAYTAGYRAVATGGRVTREPYQEPA